MIILLNMRGIEFLDRGQFELGRDIGKNGLHMNQIRRSIEAITFDLDRRFVFSDNQIKNRLQYHRASLSRLVIKKTI